VEKDKGSILFTQHLRPQSIYEKREGEKEFHQHISRIALSPSPSLLSLQARGPPIEVNGKKERVRRKVSRYEKGGRSFSLLGAELTLSLFSFALPTHAAKWKEGKRTEASGGGLAFPKKGKKEERGDGSTTILHLSAPTLRGKVKEGKKRKWGPGRLQRGREGVVFADHSLLPSFLFPTPLGIVGGGRKEDAIWIEKKGKRRGGEEKIILPTQSLYSSPSILSTGLNEKEKGKEREGSKVRTL